MGRSPGVRLLVLAVAAVTALAGCLGSTPPSPSVRVGVGSTDEQQALAAVTVVALERAGLSVEVQTDMGDTVDLRREAIRGNIDLYWDYSGAAWALGLFQQSPPADPVESFERVARADEERGLVWLEPTEVNATLALFVRSDAPQTMSELAHPLSSGEEILCADEDFIRRPGGLDALTRAYSIDRHRLQVEPADEDEAVAGVAAGDCFAGLATATSGEARRAGLTPAEDDLVVLPAFVVAPVARADALERVSEIETALAPAVEALDTPTLASLNAEMAAGADREQLEGLAEDVLVEEDTAAARKRSVTAEGLTGAPRGHTFQSGSN